MKASIMIRKAADDRRIRNTLTPGPSDVNSLRRIIKQTSPQMQTPVTTHSRRLTTTSPFVVSFALLAGL
jgi:hypothetical protein